MDFLKIENAKRFKFIFSHSDFFENISVLDKCSVPIIKLTDKKTNLNIDISFNTVRALPTVEWIEGLNFFGPFYVKKKGHSILDKK